MLKIALLCSASVLAFCVGGAASVAKPPVPVTRGAGEGHRIVSASPGSVTLYDQNNDDNGYAAVSMNFTDGFFTTYSSYGADDFVIPTGHKWKIREVEVTGTYGANGGGPATSENVLFYRNSGGLPGVLVAECDNIQGHENRGSFAISIPRTCKVSLKGGRTYWVSVVPNVDFDTSGEWFWETRNNQNGYQDVWENPDDGFGTGCRTWTVTSSCLGSQVGPDFMFALKGADILQ